MDVENEYQALQVIRDDIREIRECLHKLDDKWLELFQNGPLMLLTTRMAIVEKEMAAVKWIGGIVGGVLITFMVYQIMYRIFGGG